MPMRPLAVLALALASVASAAEPQPHFPTEIHESTRLTTELYCDIQYQDALRHAKQFRGDERRLAEAAAKAQRDACRKKAKKAQQVEDVMPRVYPR